MHTRFNTLRTMQVLLAVFIVGSAVPLAVMKAMRAEIAITHEDVDDIVFQTDTMFLPRNGSHVGGSPLKITPKKDLKITAVLPQITVCRGLCTFSFELKEGDQVLASATRQLAVDDATAGTLQIINDLQEHFITPFPTVTLLTGKTYTVRSTLRLTDFSGNSPTVSNYTQFEMRAHDAKWGVMEKDAATLTNQASHNGSDFATPSLSLVFFGSILDSCTDSDGGLDANVRGEAKWTWNGKEYSGSDYCENTYATDPGQINSLGEYTCEGGASVVRLVQCPYACQDGRCIDANTVTDTALKVSSVWLTKEEGGCKSFANGEEEECVNFRLWIDVLNIAGKRPAPGSDIKVTASVWNEREQRFPPDSPLAQYAYKGNADEQYFGVQKAFDISQLPRKERVLITVEQEGQKAIKEVVLEYSKSVPSVSSAGAAKSSAPWAATSSKSRTSSSVFRCPELPPMPQARAGCIQFKAIQPDGCYLWSERCQTASSAVTHVTPPAGYEEPVIVNGDTEKNWFSDVSLSDSVGVAANELATKGIVGGYPDGTFRPDQTVNRAEAAKFLILAKYGDFGGEIRNNGKFKDVLDGQWYTKYVMAAAALNVIAGNPDGTFRPGNPVNTAEFLKMLTLAFGLELNLDYDYADVRNEDWFSPYAGIAQKHGLFPARGTNLEPERPMTRGEVAYAISRILNR